MSGFGTNTIQFDTGASKAPQKWSKHVRCFNEPHIHTGLFSPSFKAKLMSVSGPHSWVSGKTRVVLSNFLHILVVSSCMELLKMLSQSITLRDCFRCWPACTSNKWSHSREWRHAVHMDETNRVNHESICKGCLFLLWSMVLLCIFEERAWNQVFPKFRALLMP